MELGRRDRVARSRRWFLAALPAACLAKDAEKGRAIPSAIVRYADTSTDFPVYRLTDPAHTSRLPAYYSRAVSKRNHFLLHASDITGRFEAYQLDLKNGQQRQLTESEDLDPGSLALLPDDRGFCYLDGDRLMTASLASLKSRVIYRIGEGFERGAGSSIALDGQYAAMIEKKGTRHRLLLVRMTTGMAQTLVECDEELRDPIPRPRRAALMYRRGASVSLVDYEARLNRPLKLADGETGPAQWSPDGRAVLYLNYPANPHKLHNLREFTPDSNTDALVADTSQFVAFGLNADASVFVGASGSKASPHLLLLVRAVKRELTLAEHRASDPRMVAPIFTPNSQRVLFVSDRHGKPAIYLMTVDRLVAETETL